MDMKRKAPDYDLFYEKVGDPSLERREATLNFFLGYLQMLAELSDSIEKLLPEELKEVYNYQIRELTKFQDFEVIGKMTVSSDYLAQLKTASLKEA